MAQASLVLACPHNYKKTISRSKSLILRKGIKGKTFLDVADFVAPLVPLGLMFGRIGNFINGELWGRAAGADVPWAMIFKNSGTLVPRLVVIRKKRPVVAHCCWTFLV